MVVVLIVLGVLALAGLRAWTWVRKERLLREAGLLTAEESAETSPERRDRA